MFVFLTNLSWRNIDKIVYLFLDFFFVFPFIPLGNLFLYIIFYLFSFALIVAWLDGWNATSLTPAQSFIVEQLPKPISVDHKGHSTVVMVIILVSVVGGVFVLFALMALCYRSVVVHRNLSLCIRLVIFVQIHSTIISFNLPILFDRQGATSQGDFYLEPIIWLNLFFYTYILFTVYFWVICTFIGNLAKALFFLAVVE